LKFSWVHIFLGHPVSKCLPLHPNLNEAFLICPDLIEAVEPYPNAPDLLKCF